MRGRQRGVAWEFQIEGTIFQLDITHNLGAAPSNGTAALESGAFTPVFWSLKA